MLTGDIEGDRSSTIALSTFGLCPTLVRADGAFGGETRSNWEKVVDWLSLDLRRLRRERP